MAPRMVSLPAKMDLRLYDSPIENQSPLGACVAHATTSALEMLEIKASAPKSKILAWIKLTAIKVGRAVLNFFRVINWYAKDLSRLFVYYNARDLEGMAASDSGCNIRDAIKTLSNQGVCQEKEWPYNPNMVTTKPRDDCYTDAKNHIVDEYKAVQTLDDIRSCIASGYPVVIGMTIYYSFEFGSINQTGIVTMPNTGEDIIGSHAVLVVGYDDNKQLLTVRNSWGDKWGKGGYFYLPYNYAKDPSLVWDCWVMYKMEGE